MPSRWSYARTLAAATLSAWAAVATAADTRAVLLSVEQAPAQPVLIEEIDGRLYLERASLPEALFEPAALAELEAYSEPPCEDCVPLDELGFYEEDAQASTARLTLFARMKRVRDFTRFQPQPASSAFLQRRSGLSGNLTLSGRRFRERDPLMPERAQAPDTGWLAGLDLAASLGGLGVLRSGVRVVRAEQEGPVNTRRLPSFFEHHFVDAQTTFRLGELESRVDPNAAGFRLLGFQLGRNFATRPDIIDSPVFSFFDELERPSVVDLFVDGQQVRREQVDEPGFVRLDDFQPSRPGRVTLVITDALGVQRVVEADFFGDRRLLRQGRWDFDLAGGVVQLAEDELSEAYSLGTRLGYGFTQQFSAALLAEGVRFEDLTSPESLGRSEAWTVGGSAILATGLGKFDALLRYSGSDLGDRGYSSNLGWQSLFRFPRYGIAVGGSGFYEEGFQPVVGLARERRGGRVYLSFLTPMASLNTSAFHFRSVNQPDVRGTAVSLVVGPRSSLRLALGASLREGLPASYTAFLSYNFGRVQVASGAQVVDNVEGAELRHSLRAFSTGGDYALSASHSRPTGRSDTEAPATLERTSAQLSANTSLASVVYGYRSVDPAYEHRLDLRSGFIVSDAGTVRLSRPFGRNSGYAVVDLGIPDVEVRYGGTLYRTNEAGLATFPVPGFGRRFASLEEASLPEGSVIPTRRFDVSTVPGQGARATARLEVPAAFLEIAGAREGEIVLVNGVEHRYYDDFGIYTEALKLGPNRVEWRGSALTLTISRPDLTLPTYRLGDAP